MIVMDSRVSFLLCSLVLLLNFTFGHSLGAEEECGKLHSKEAADKGEWPWKVSIFLVELPDAKKYRCGATLISKDYIVTSARCVTLPNRRIRFGLNNLEIVMGAKRTTHDLVGPNLQRFYPTKIILHEHFDPQFTAYDIALLKLDRPVEINEFVHPICLWEGNVNITNVLGKTGTISGYESQLGVYTNEQSELKVVPVETCLSAHPVFLIAFNLDRTLCAGSRSGVITCPAQTGSGLYFPRSSKSKIWQLRALKSTALYPHGVGAPCGFIDYVLFTDVAQYNDWIKRKLEHGDDDTEEEKEVDVVNGKSTDWMDKGCRKLPSKNVPLISHSQGVTPDDWPWHVAIYRLYGSNLTYLCGGTLISDRFVLTSAHCITEAGDKDAIPANKVQVYLGVNRLRELSGATPVQFAAELIVHPDYNESNLRNDIGLIKLQKRVEFTSTVWPICISDGNESIGDLFGKHSALALSGLSGGDSKPQKGAGNADKGLSVVADLAQYLPWVKQKTEQ